MLDAGYTIIRRFNILDELLNFHLACNFSFRTIKASKPRFKIRRLLRVHETGIDRPVFLWNEIADFSFSFYNHPQGNGLNPTC